MAAFCDYWRMTPPEVRAMRVDEFRAFKQRMKEAGDGTRT